MSEPALALDRPVAPVAPDTRKPALFPLEARGLVLDIDGHRLIDHVDLTLGFGPLTVVMGPNGAGKSLLLRLLHGLIAPSAGQIAWAGRPADRQIRLAQAMVFQRPVILRRSVAANIRHALRTRGISGSALATRMGEVLAAARLEARAHTPGRALSGGEQQRLAVARALALEPRVLFLDEPTVNLDPASTEIVETMVSAAHEAGTKIVLITHDRAQARRLADEVVVMHSGRIVEEGPAERVFAAPASREARAYLAGELLV